jgi:pyruvate/2-oxoglutarate dehydrogenase complex dihydrolipoamide acyltransferase (E2) component
VAKVTMPRLGENVAEGTIGRWLKKPGELVAKDEPLLEVVTDKVDAEVPSPYAGVLVEILVAEGAVVPTDADIAVIDTDGGEAVAVPAPASPASAPSPSTPLAPSPAPAPPGSIPAAAAPAQPTPPAAPVAVTVAASAAPAGPTPGPEARMTPAVRRLLRERGLTGAGIVPTGGGGRLTRADVLAFVSGAAPVAGAPATPAADAPAASATPPASAADAGYGGIVFPPGVDEVVVPVTQMRRGIAAQMTRALEVPHAYVTMEVDVTELVRLRESLKRASQARDGLSLSYVPFVVAASIGALRRNPTFNGHWTERGLVAKRPINVGVAVAVADGLLVPVIRDADRLSITGLNRAIAEVAARARAGKLRIDDFGGGTFTVDNTGWLGSALTLPIVNVPEVAILTMEAITKRAVVVETPDGDGIAIRSMMNMVIGFDHRAHDGAGAAAFLRDVKAWLESVGPDTPVA